MPIPPAAQPPPDPFASATLGPIRLRNRIIKAATFEGRTPHQVVTDDPEGAQVLAECHDRAAGDPDVHVVELPPTSNLEINAIQRASTVILQKSLREGFGLTVSEALWKARPVIAGAVGGIPLQVSHKYSGILTHTVEGTAYWIKQFLNEPEFARRLGENGREHVRWSFLLTRHLRDYMLLFLSRDYPGKSLVELG